MRIGILGAVCGLPENTKERVGYTLIGLKGAQTMYVKEEGNREGVAWWCFVVEVVVVEAKGRGRERGEREGARGEARFLFISLSRFNNQTKLYLLLHSRVCNRKVVPSAQQHKAPTLRRLEEVVDKQP